MLCSDGNHGKCCEAIDLIVEFAAKGSKLAISDAGCWGSFLQSSITGASLNVYINTKSMANREYAEELNKKADAMLEKYTKIADETFESVLGRLNRNTDCAKRVLQSNSHL